MMLDNRSGEAPLGVAGWIVALGLLALGTALWLFVVPPVMEYVNTVAADLYQGFDAWIMSSGRSTNV